MEINIAIADYRDRQQAEDIVFLLDRYARDAAGGGKALSNYVRENLIVELAKLPFAFSILAYVEGKPAGLINCFTVFSTFKCQPVINIHDLAVLKEFRKQGISQLMLEKVEDIARNKNACKITLEVLENNLPARNAYEKFGFVGYELDPKYGNAIFLEKALSMDNG